MPNGGLQAATVVALLESPDAEMRDTAWRVVARHQDWGEALAAYFQQRMAKADQSAAELGTAAAEAGAVWQQRGRFSSSLARP